MFIWPFHLPFFEPKQSYAGNIRSFVHLLINISAATTMHIWGQQEDSSHVAIYDPTPSGCGNWSPSFQSLHPNPFWIWELGPFVSISASQPLLLPQTQACSRSYRQPRLFPQDEMLSPSSPPGPHLLTHTSANNWVTPLLSSIFWRTKQQGVTPARGIPLHLGSRRPCGVPHTINHKHQPREP
jgi:hypothetical protein